MNWKSLKLAAEKAGIVVDYGCAGEEAQMFIWKKLAQNYSSAYELKNGLGLSVGNTVPVIFDDVAGDVINLANVDSIYEYTTPSGTPLYEDSASYSVPYITSWSGLVPTIDKVDINVTMSDLEEEYQTVEYWWEYYHSEWWDKDNSEKEGLETEFRNMLSKFRRKINVSIQYPGNGSAVNKSAYMININKPKYFYYSVRKGYGTTLYKKDDDGDVVYAYGSGYENRMISEWGHTKIEGNSKVDKYPSGFHYWFETDYRKNIILHYLFRGDVWGDCPFSWKDWTNNNHWEDGYIDNHIAIYNYGTIDTGVHIQDDARTISFTMTAPVYEPISVEPVYTKKFTFEAKSGESGTNSDPYAQTPYVNVPSPRLEIPQYGCGGYGGHGGGGGAGAATVIIRRYSYGDDYHTEEIGHLCNHGYGSGGGAGGKGGDGCILVYW